MSVMAAAAARRLHRATAHAGSGRRWRRRTVLAAAPENSCSPSLYPTIVAVFRLLSMLRTMSSGMPGFTSEILKNSEPRSIPSTEPPAAGRAVSASTATAAAAQLRRPPIRTAQGCPLLAQGCPLACAAEIGHSCFLPRWRLAARRRRHPAEARKRATTEYAPAVSGRQALTPEMRPRRRPEPQAASRADDSRVAIGDPT